jgi:hypothetical protein
MYSLLCRHTDVGTQSRKFSQFSAQVEYQLSHFHYAWEEKKSSRVKMWLQNHKHAQEVLLLVVMLGTCMFISDGVLTLAILDENLLLLTSGDKNCFFSIINIHILLLQAIYVLNFVGTRLHEDMRFAIVWSLDVVLSVIGGIKTKFLSIS